MCVLESIWNTCTIQHVTQVVCQLTRERQKFKAAETLTMPNICHCYSPTQPTSCNAQSKPMQGPCLPASPHSPQCWAS